MDATRASRIQSLLALLVRSFSTTLRPALRAAACGGRPRPAGASALGSYGFPLRDV